MDSKLKRAVEERPGFWHGMGSLNLTGVAIVLEGLDWAYPAAILILYRDAGTILSRVVDTTCREP